MSIFNSDLRLEEISSLLKDVKKSFRFVGALGSGMYPLARILSGRGFSVSGSDDAVVDDSTVREGITVTRPREVIDADAVVYSLAIDESNSEIRYARAHGIPLISRAQLLGALMQGYATRVAVSGSHGKSTVTALIDHILSVASIPHTAVSGASLSSGASFHDGGGEVFVAEACEYKDSFLRLYPTHRIITAVELDHTDYFESLAVLKASFLKAATTAEVLLANADDDNAHEIALKARAVGTKVFTYGRCDNADYRFVHRHIGAEVTELSVFTPHREIRLRTSLFGEFNLYNLSAAVAMADILGVRCEDIESAVATFRTVDRRMTVIAEGDGVSVYYDYAHHPTEIREVIRALKERYGTLAVIFRPHTYSRTESLWRDFITELSKADFTILLDIYPAREDALPGVTSEMMAKEIENCQYADIKDAAKIALSVGTRAVALLGAGEVECVRCDLVSLCKNTGYHPERR